MEASEEGLLESERSRRPQESGPQHNLVRAHRSSQGLSRQSWHLYESDVVHLFISYDCVA